MAPSNLKTKRKMNNTRSRGYLWLSIFIVLILVLLLLWGARRGRDGQQTFTDEEARQEIDTFQQKETLRRTNKQQRRTDTKNIESCNAKAESGYTYVTERESHTPTASSRPIFAETKPFVIELNTADTNDLKELRGIGSYFARAIVRYRDQLGGFVSQDQLMEVPGMTPERYQKALRNVVCLVDSMHCRKLVVNKDSIQVLKRHPYLDYWQAKGIVQLREKGVRYQEWEDLLQVSTIDTTTLRKLQPYLSFE